MAQAVPLLDSTVFFCLPLLLTARAGFLPDFFPFNSFGQFAGSSSPSIGGFQDFAFALISVDQSNQRHQW
jgi:hypothetical protein